MVFNSMILDYARSWEQLLLTQSDYKLVQPYTKNNIQTNINV